ncbi:MAG: hypothetical protein RL119_1635, partial [Actinomycetota bacterium]
NEINEPDVSLPSELPTKLIITELTEGTGPAAVDGDTVYVNYVGVLSKDGTRFDGNFGLEAFGVTLGTGSVIAGWEQGLLGIKTGGRRQLDIPADLAYGEDGAGDIIQPGDALSFIVDAVAIVPKISRRDEPREEITGRDPVTELVTEDLVTGSGDPIKAGDRVILHLQAYRADTGELLETTWEFDVPLDITLVQDATLDGLLQGIPGMQVGGRRVITIPFELAFGAEGNTELGLPASTDLLVIIDVFAVLPAK